MARAQAPDTILINGKVLTVDAQDNVAQAVAIANGKITAVGTTADIQRRAGPATRVIDLHGLTATPGLIDTHAHMAWGGVDEMYHVVLSDVSSVDEALAKVRETAASLKPGEWLGGRGMGRRQARRAALPDGVGPR
jgi:predicted amidohydrolase YtcJ